MSTLTDVRKRIEGTIDLTPRGTDLIVALLEQELRELRHPMKWKAAEGLKLLTALRILQARRPS